MIFSKTRTVALLLLGLCWNLDTILAQELPVDMAPTMAEPAGKPVPRDPFCENDDVACVALLPALLKATYEGDRLRVSAQVKPDAQKLSVCGRDGGSLLFQNLKDGENHIDLSLLPKAGAPEPVVAKLLDSQGLLLDIVALHITKPR